MVWIWIGWVLVLTFGIVVFRGAPYVPSRRRYIKQAFTDLYPLNSKDVLVDVGSGDGIVLRIASEYGTKAIGLELNPVLVLISRLLSRRDKNVQVKLVDFWLTPLPDNTTVVYAFMVTRDIKKITKKMQAEANRLGRSLAFITYGNRLPGREYNNALVGYALYTFVPLQIS
ncbi:methyltransferase domain-containing protein [Patescibacteria group bacterium]|nr:MAG: methyltransferase domain-containing protein [Patescibacteria group bacterium]